MCAKSQNQPVENIDAASLRACLVDGDADQLSRARRTRRHSLLLSVLVQIAILAALILIPILSKAPRIALANVMPVPPYYHTAVSEHAMERPHHVIRTHELRFASNARRYSPGPQPLRLIRYNRATPLLVQI